MGTYNGCPFDLQNKDDPIKKRALEWPQDYMSIFQTPKGRYFRSHGEILPKFELIRTFMNVLNTCKNEEDRD